MIASANNTGNTENPEACPICWEASSTAKPLINLCNNQHNACANCVKSLAEKAIQLHCPLPCMLCRTPVDPEKALRAALQALKSQSTVFIRLNIDELTSSDWMLLTRQFDRVEQIEIEGTIFTKRDCLIQAAKLVPTHIDAWAELGLSLSDGEHVVINQKYYDKPKCFNMASNIANTQPNS